MRYSRSDLLQLKGLRLILDEDISFTQELCKQFNRIKRIDSINVKADGKYDPESQHLDVTLNIKGKVVVPCDITGEDVTLDIDTSSDETFTFNKKDEDIDAIRPEGETINLLPTIFQLIMLEIPIKVVKPGEIEYPNGDGWEVVSEKDYQNNKNHVDPRLAILKEYKPQKEEV